MRRIGLAVVLALGFTLAPLAAEAQQAGKVYRVGVLNLTSRMRQMAFVRCGRGCANSDTRRTRT